MLYFFQLIIQVHKFLFFSVSNIAEGYEAILKEQILKDHGHFPPKAKPGEFEGLWTSMMAALFNSKFLIVTY